MTEPTLSSFWIGVMVGVSTMSFLILIDRLIVKVLT